MAEENGNQEVEPEQIDAPEQTETASESQEKQPERTFTQQELDEVVQKRIAKEQRKFERQMAQYEAQLAKSSEAELTQPDKPIRREDFDDYEAYLEAKTERKVEERLRKEEMERRKEAAEFSRTYEQRQFNDKLGRMVDVGKGKYEDFNTVVSKADVPLNSAMAEAIVEAENGADLAYYLAKNPDEARRISELSGTLSAIEIGKLSVSLNGEAKPKRASSAPAPITPSKGRTPANSSQPQDSDDIDTWMRKERERVRNARR